MNIGGPFLNESKRGQPKPWYLSYFVARLKPDGSAELDAEGKPLMKRVRPYYESKAKAKADIDRIREQHAVSGSGQFLHNRESAAEYEKAKKIVGAASLIDVARFWRRHHPEKPKAKLGELKDLFLADIESRLGKERHWSDRKSRLGKFLAAGFADRYPETVERVEIMAYLRDMQDAAPRTRRNHKNALSEFFSWMVDQQHTPSNPAAGIKKRMLPREEKKEIGFLTLEEVERYLRTAERYDPELVAHEVVQLIAGVRADDEMADFQAEFVLPATKEIVIPAAIAKTETREVINQVEENFWDWWKAYGPKAGLLRPKNYGPRWDRLRILARVSDEAKAAELAKLPIKQLKRIPGLLHDAVRNWPWNARRRTFCTFHVAKHQSADKTALIMRHRGSPYTLHNSYRGLGVTQPEGTKYFALCPMKCDKVIRPELPLRGFAMKRV